MYTVLPRAVIFLLLLAAVLLLSSPLRVRPNRRALMSKGKEKPLDKLIAPLIRLLAKALNLSSYKRLKLLNDLERAGIDQTPEEYYADAVVKGVGVSLLSILFYLAGMAVPAVAFLVAGVLVYMREVKRVDDKLKKKDEEIQFALPHFVSVVSDTFKRDKNIANIFERYLHDIPDTPLAVDLKKTIALMKANGNVPDALAQMDKTIGNMQLSSFLTALSEASRGIDQSMYFVLCAEQMRDLRIQNIRKRTAHRPRKMQAISYTVAGAAVLLFVVPLVLQIFTINTLF